MNGSVIPLCKFASCQIGPFSSIFRSSFSLWSMWFSAGQLNFPFFWQQNIEQTLKLWEYISSKYTATATGCKKTLGCVMALLTIKPFLHTIYPWPAITCFHSLCKAKPPSPATCCFLHTDICRNNSFYLYYLYEKKETLGRHQLLLCGKNLVMGFPRWDEPALSQYSHWERCFEILVAYIGLYFNYFMLKAQNPEQIHLLRYCRYVVA